MNIEQSAKTIDDYSRELLNSAMGKEAWTYDSKAVAEIYNTLDNCPNFERLVQVLIGHKQSLEPQSVEL